VSLDEYIQSLKTYKGFAGDIVCQKSADGLMLLTGGSKAGWIK